MTGGQGSPSLSNLRIGYTPFSPDMSHPADRRRFPAYARAKAIQIESAQLSEDYDVVIVTLAADLSQWSRKSVSRTKIVFDPVDSYFTIPRTNLKGLLRGTAKFLAGKHSALDFSYWKVLDRMFERADAVVCSTAAQMEYAQRFCANTHFILDIHDDVATRVKHDYRPREDFRIVWEGMPENVRTLAVLAGPLARLNSARKTSLHVATLPVYHQYMARYRQRSTIRLLRKIFPQSILHRWDQHTLAEVCTSCDLAVIPLPLNGTLERAKPANKLLSFWRMGMPVITSDTPEYLREMRQAGLDMCCHSEEDWTRALDFYSQNEAARREAGQRGRAYVEANWSTRHNLARWDSLMITLFPQFGSAIAQGHGN